MLGFMMMYARQRGHWQRMATSRMYLGTKIALMHGLVRLGFEVPRAWCVSDLWEASWLNRAPTEVVLLGSSLRRSPPQQDARACSVRAANYDELQAFQKDRKA